MKDVPNDMNATEDFFETVGVGHIIAATLQFFGMEDISDSPHNQSLQDAVKLPQVEKWLVLSTCIGDPVDLLCRHWTWWLKITKTTWHETHNHVGIGEVSL